MAFDFNTVNTPDDSLIDIIKLYAVNIRQEFSKFLAIEKYNAVQYNSIGKITITPKLTVDLYNQYTLLKTLILYKIFKNTSYDIFFKKVFVYPPERSYSPFSITFELNDLRGLNPEIYNNYFLINYYENKVTINDPKFLVFVLFTWIYFIKHHIEYKTLHYDACIKFMNLRYMSINELTLFLQEWVKRNKEYKIDENISYDRIINIIYKGIKNYLWNCINHHNIKLPKYIKTYQDFISYDFHTLVNILLTKTAFKRHTIKLT